MLMELCWQIIALLMILSSCLGFCIGWMVTEMRDRSVQTGDRKVQKGCCPSGDTLCLDGIGSATTTMIPDHLGTEFDVDRDVNRWKFWEADQTETVFLVTKSGTCVHLKDRCPGLNGTDPAYPLKKYTLCGHCRKWKIAQENQKHGSQRKNK